MTKRTTFRQADLKRALRAAADAGLKVARIEIDPSGNIVIVSASDGSAEPQLASVRDFTL